MRKLFMNEKEFDEWERKKLLEIEASLGPWEQKKDNWVMAKAPVGYESKVRYFFLYMYFHRWGFVISLFLYPMLIWWYIHR